MDKQTENKPEMIEMNIEYIKNRCKELIDLYQVENNVDIMTITPIQWNHVLYYLCHNIFIMDNKKLLDYKNIELLDNIVDIYIYDLCQKYNKTVSMHGFSIFTGININTMYQWYNGITRTNIYIDTRTNTIIDYKDLALYKSNNKYSNIIEMPNNKYIELVKKIKLMREHNLTDKAESGSVMALALGKIENGWIEGGKEQLQAAAIAETYRLPGDILAKYTKGK